MPPDTPGPLGPPHPDQVNSFMINLYIFSFLFMTAMAPFIISLVGRVDLEDADVAGNLEDVLEVLKI